MKTSMKWITPLFATVLLSVSPALAVASAPTQFDLVCSGTVSRAGMPLDKETTFTKRLRVDLTRKVFCDDKLCANLVSTDEATLEYHCDYKKLEKYCQPEGSSIGGPFIFSDDLVFDRSGGSFLRQVDGSVGDMNPNFFTETYLGNCRISEFTGLTYSPDPAR